MERRLWIAMDWREIAELQPDTQDQRDEAQKSLAHP
jgi:hypothetical protein